MTRPLLPQQVRTATLPDGTLALVVEPVIPDDAPLAVREGIARRHLVNSGRACPCGARVALPNRAARRARRGSPPVVRVPVEHAVDCPAGDDALTAALDAWQGGRAC